MNKSFMLRGVAFACATFMSVCSLWADPVKVGNLYYNLDSEAKTATVARNTEYKSFTSVVIPGSVTVEDATYTVKAVAQQAFQDCTSLTEVSFDDGVEDIGKWAFYRCSGIVTLNLPSTLTKVQDSGFSKCTSIKTLVLPDNLVEIGSYGFGTLSGLTSLTLPAKMQTLKSSAFSGCSKLEEINFNSGITTVDGNAFYSCGIKNLKVPSTLKVITGGAFSRCPNLVSVELAEGVEEIGESAFYECNALASINLPASLTKLGANALYNCSALTQIEIPATIKEISGYAFYGCSGLESVIWPESVATIGKATFYGCTGLREISIPSTVSNIDEMAFQDCTSLSSITLPEALTTISPGLFNGCKSLTALSIPSGVTTISENAFRSSGLRTLDIPASVSEIGAPIVAGCNALTNINVSADNATFASVDGVLFDKGVTCLLAYPEGKSGEYVMPESVTEIGGWSFIGNNGVSAITFSPNLKKIGPSAFYQCTGLTALDFPQSLTSIESTAFFYASKIASVKLPNTDIFIGNNAFSATGLKSVIFPATITNIGVEESQTYSIMTMCSSLKWVSLPSSLTTFSPLGLYCGSLATIYSFAVTPPAISGGNANTATLVIKVPKGSADAYAGAWSTLYPGAKFEGVLPGAPVVNIDGTSATLKWEAYSDDNLAAPSRYTLTLTDGTTTVADIELTGEQAAGINHTREFNNLAEGTYTYDLKGYVSTGELILSHTDSFVIGTSGIDGIEDSMGEVLDTKYFGLDGREIINPVSGTICIVKAMHADGTVSTSKKVIK